MSIANNLRKLKSSIPKKVTLVAVSKNKSNTDILEAYKCGQINFGENRVQELVNKYEFLPKDIKWHMIGHLQTNKVKHIASFIHLIHSVDSLKLLKEINKRGKENKRTINCLLQIYIAKERSKYGLSIDSIDDMLLKGKELKNVNIVGLMGIATNTLNNDVINNEFTKLKNVYNQLNNTNINILSIGMSNDYKIAIENNSNMIRIGSAIFGKRIQYE